MSSITYNKISCVFCKSQNYYSCSNCNITFQNISNNYENSVNIIYFSKKYINYSITVNAVKNKTTIRHYHNIPSSSITTSLGIKTRIINYILNIDNENVDKLIEKHIKLLSIS